MVLGSNTLSLRDDILEQVEKKTHGLETAAGQVADFAPIVEGVQTTLSTHEIMLLYLSAQRFYPTAPEYGAVPGTGVGSSVVEANNAAFAACVAACKTANGLMVINDTFELSEMPQFQCHMDGTGGILRMLGTDFEPAVRVGTTATFTTRLYCSLPAVMQIGDKGGNGVWTESIGLQCVNLITCTVVVPHVRNFGIGLHIYAVGTGNGYNRYMIGHLDNNKINQVLEPGASNGWVNENGFDYGRYSHDSIEGTNISGCRHIEVRSNGVHPANNNRWLKPSIERDAPDYHVHLTNAWFNIFDQARWEAVTPKVHQIDCNANTFWYGYFAHAIVHTWTNTFNQHLYDRGKVSIYGEHATLGALNLSNRVGASAAALMIFNPAATTPFVGSEYSAKMSATQLSGKRTADAFNRIELNYETAALRMGGGTIAPPAQLSTVSTGGHFFMNNGLFVSNQTQAGMFAISGSPNGAQAASPGAKCQDLTGKDWIKVSGSNTNTGWSQVATI
jgi:hypothetical protein